MDHLQAMQVFSRVVETKNFNKASEALGILPSMTLTAFLPA
jgi:DNA-binding transcriptional LysR family regulator